MRLPFLLILFKTAFTFSQSIYTKPIYSGEYTVIDCFNNNTYKGVFKTETIKSNYLLNGIVLWRTIYLDIKENALIFNSTTKCASIGLFEIIKFGLFEKKLNAFASDNFNDTKTPTSPRLIVSGNEH